MRDVGSLHMKIFQIFITYFKIGCFTFGSGYTMLPLLERELIEKQKWIDNDTLYNYFALAQSVPGIVAVNTATFLGYRMKGFWGALAAAMGMILPSLILITVIAAFFHNLADNEAIQKIFRGLNIAITALLIKTLWTMGRRSIKDIITAAIFGAALLINTIWGINPIYFIICGGILGLLLSGRVKQ